MCLTLQSLSRAAGSENPVGPRSEPDEVREERARVFGAHKDALRLLALAKTYRNRLGQPHNAVKHVSLGVRQGECMALLGVNGAGKTTTFRIITGELEPSSGSVLIDRHEELGYCPQEEAADAYLSVSETLSFVGRLKGYRGSGLASVIQRSMDRFGLTKEADTRVKDLSGGKRRSLCVAGALVGEPSLVVLDEPSEGMDPKAKRLLWAALSRLLRSGRSLLLTSHSMEECEALATRLALLLRGNLATIGTQAAVKAKYGEGYTLGLEVRERGQLGNLEAWVGHNWPWAAVRERQGRRLTLTVPARAPLPLSALFTRLEALKAQLALAHYSVTQTTLDQVFVDFAMSAKETEKEAKPSPAIHL